jgi:hypothetical protein
MINSVRIQVSGINRHEFAGYYPADHMVSECHYINILTSSVNVFKPRHNNVLFHVLFTKEFDIISPNLCF